MRSIAARFNEPDKHDYVVTFRGDSGAYSANVTVTRENGSCNINIKEIEDLN